MEKKKEREGKSVKRKRGRETCGATNKKRSFIQNVP